MAPRGFTDEERGRIRQRLVEVGKAHFERFGPQKTNVAELAAEVGIAKGSFYLFFPSKEHLMMEILEELEDRTRTQVVASMQEAERPPKEVFKKVFRVGIEAFETEPLASWFLDRANIEYMARKVPPERLQQHVEGDDEFVEQMVRGWVDAGHMRDVDPAVVAGLTKLPFLLLVNREMVSEEAFPAVMQFLVDALADALFVEQEEVPMIEVEDLRFTYPRSKRETIRGLSFGVADGEIFGFLGPSGSGKSTTQKILIGLLKRYGGTVRVFGHKLRGHTQAYHERIGVSFELPNLYMKLTARENLEFFGSLYDVPCEEPDELLHMVGLGDAADTKVAHYSKGMKMRLNFCRALLNRPKLLFLDEPTGGLDPTNARKLKDIVLQRRESGTTVFLTTHDMHVAAELCDRVAFLVDGEIVLVESPHELMVERSGRVVRVETGSNGQAAQQEFALDGIGANEQFLALLREGPIRTIHTQEATLEDVFVEVTGRNLQ